MESPWDDNSDARPPDEASEAPGERLKPTGPRWQFSLRTLFILFTLIAVVAGAIVVDVWRQIVFFGSLQLCFSLAAIHLYVVGVARRLSRHEVMKLILLVFLFVLMIWVWDRDPNDPFLDNVLTFSIETIHHPYLILPLWLLAWITWRVVIRDSRKFAYEKIRRAAILSTVWSVCLFSCGVGLTGLQNSHSDTRNLDFVMFFVPVASFVVLIPWLRLVCKKNAAHYRQYSCWETVSKCLLLLSITAASISLGSIVYLYVKYCDNDRLVWWIENGHYFLLPQMTSASIFGVALCLELYRDRWHKKLTLINSIYFVSFWLLVVANPEILLLPL